LREVGMEGYNDKDKGIGCKKQCKECGINEGD
jgi:hypothetical protein